MLKTAIGAALVAAAGLGAAAQADLIVTEIMFNASSPETPGVDNWEYVEIYNNGSTTVDLTGWVFDDSAGPQFTAANIASGSIAPGTFAVLFDSAAQDLAEMQGAWGAGINFIGVSTWSNLNNGGGDRIGLWASLADYGTTRDFSTAQVDQPYTDLAPWPTDNGSASFTLRGLDLDGSMGENWALSELGDAFGTYQSTAFGSNNGQDIGNPGTIPAPGALALAAIGGLIVARRRR